MALGFPYDPQYVHLMGTWWWTILKPLDCGRTYFATKPCICLWNFRWNLRLQCTIASYHANILRPLFWRMIYATDVHVFLDRQCIVVLVRMWNMFSGGTKPVQLLLDLQKSMMLCFMVYFNAVHGCGIFQVWTHTHFSMFICDVRRGTSHLVLPFLQRFELPWGPTMCPRATLLND